ncbi:PDZ domain-containing protein [Dyadobacter chenwenxiniae]|uniref:PDZ domain-containing protein n=1 Tax=Dyadobacter chenwenxiniae TaxID=2906456 RepID=A0A9X1PMB3_9BACT|nr:PDZ domain-containing protein [Dyadobacter chenwenxiniae]MCF0063466.1 PDZ domain-containing protein [Dyadobacter chenwenxiniae]UON85155.1 PDZ domain-containing protein [Dyadobacter chenwenxiniae]
MKKLFYLSAFQLFAGYAFAQKINYEVSFPNLVHHEANIAVIVSDAPQKELTFRMSRSSPGRYATHEYGKNVYDVKAFDKAGREVAVERVDGDVYKVTGLNGFVKMQYTLYANHADGTYAGLDQNSVHLNAPATFMWVKELQNTPIEVKFDVPKDGSWTIATQLKPGPQPNTFSASDLQYFMDSPIKIGKLAIKEWTLNNPDKKPAKFRLALEVTGSESLADDFAAKVKRVTQESQIVFGAFPAFDFGQYTFLASINPYVKGDGMEHRNSTMISIPVAFDGSSNLLGVFSHEFFHAWNVERIRPKTLEPFNFEKSNMSFELWFAEGFTQYYGELILARAGFESPEDYCQTLSFLINTKENTTGAKRISPVQASCNAVFVDAGVSIDKTNYPNIYTSYYPYGASIALALDLQLRARGLTLDGYMQAVWQKHGEPEVPYQVGDLQNVLVAYSKDQAFAEGFFAKYVNGHESFDYAPLLQMAGLTLKKQFEGKAWIGDVKYKEGTELTILANTIIDSPLYVAGLDIDDQILKLDGKSVATQAELNAILNAHKPGEHIPIEYRHREETKMGMLILKENPKWIVKMNESADLPVTEEMKKFRKDWLGSKIK